MIMKIDTKALQKKLETFAGFKENRFNEPPHEVAWIEDSDGHMFTDGVPDLVNSLDAQAKWIYPKFKELNYGFNLNWDCHHNGVNEAVLYNFFGIIPKRYSASNIESIALAFALAVEKLIDQLNKEKQHV